MSQDEKGNETSYESSILSGGDGYSIINSETSHLITSGGGGAIFERDHNSLEDKDENEARPFFTTSTSSSPMQIKLDHHHQQQFDNPLQGTSNFTNLVQDDPPQEIQKPQQVKPKNNNANNKKLKKKKKQNLAQIETLN